MSLLIDESRDWPFFCCYKEVEYKQRLRWLMGAHQALRVGTFPTTPADIVMFFRPYDQLHLSLTGHTGRGKKI